MIISASRRSDIPAFYSRWFMNRIEAGFVLVANPFNSRQIRRIRLRPDAVEAIVFWTRHAAPLLPALPRLEALGYRSLFHVTLTGYPSRLEPHLPPLEQALASCRRHWPHKAIYLGAQAHLQKFYASFGFVPVTEVYDEDGIDHIGMAYEIATH